MGTPDHERKQKSGISRPDGNAFVAGCRADAHGHGVDRLPMQRLCGRSGAAAAAPSWTAAPARLRCREAVAQPFGLRPVAVTGVIALRVSTVVRTCSGPGGEVVAVQLGEVVGRH
jgi:hypothetical protein